MIEQLENTLEIITSKIKAIKALKKENKESINEAFLNGDSTQNEVEDRMSLAREYEKMLKIAKAEKKYFTENYVNKYKVKYTNVPEDVVSFLIQFFLELEIKAIASSDARYLNHATNYLQNHPLPPEHNFVVSFEVDNSTFYIIYTNYKIEVSEWVSNPQDFSNDSYQPHLVKFELGGYKEIIGDFKQLAYSILKGLNEVKVTDINISEEE